MMVYVIAIYFVNLHRVLSVLISMYVHVLGRKKFASVINYSTKTRLLLLLWIAYEFCV